MSLIVEKWEFSQRRGASFVGVDIDSKGIPKLLFSGFRRISHLLYSGAIVPASQIEFSLVDMLTSEWGFAVGRASSIAAIVRSFWDEAGVFVAQGADELVSARILLFAELGEAQLGAYMSKTDQQVWFRHHWISSNKEVIVLAAGFSTPIADDLFLEAATSDDVDHYELAIRALWEGANPSPTAYQLLLDKLITSLARPLPEAWRISALLAKCPLQEELASRTEQAWNQHLPKEYLVTIRALALAHWSSKSHANVAEHAWKELAVQGKSPKALQQEPETRVGKFFPSSEDSVYREALIASTNKLMSINPNYATIIAKAAHNGSSGTHDKIYKILASYGKEGEMTNLFPDFTKSNNALLDRLSERSQVRVDILKTLSTMSTHSATYKQRRNLEEFLQLCATIFNGELIAGIYDNVYREALSEFVSFVKIISTLAGFELGVISSQASVILSEPAIFSDSMLIGEGKKAELSSWHRFENPDLIKKLLIRWMPIHIWFFTTCQVALLQAPDRKTTALYLAGALKNFHPEVRERAAFVVIALDEDKWIKEWLTEKDTIIRGALGIWLADAWKSDGIADHRRSLKILLQDENPVVCEKIKLRLGQQVTEEILSDC